MRTSSRSDQRHAGTSGEDARRRLLHQLPVSERTYELADISTCVLEGGEGSPVVLLHGPGANALHWMHVIPDLVSSHHVVAPDLPGHGRSRIASGPIDPERVTSWLGALIERTCAEPPAVVGFALGGAVAARFAGTHRHALKRLVLVDTLGLAPFEPAPEFGAALTEFLTEPNESTHGALWQECTIDLDALRDRMGENWAHFEAYNLDRARTPSVQEAGQALMKSFGLEPIPDNHLRKIAVPTTLIWGRDDRATPVHVAQDASSRYGWPLRVIEDCGDDPAIERPGAFLRALRPALEAEAELEAAS